MSGTSSETFDKIHKFVTRWEGGYVDDPSDRGGATNFGVSLRFLKGLPIEDADINGDGVVDKRDIRDLTKDDAKRLLKKYFWDDMRLDNLETIKPRLAACCYNFAMNMGVGTARKLAQLAVGTTADGAWGPKTWKAFYECDDKTAAIQMCKLARARYERIVQNNPSQAKFLRGWLSRVRELEKLIKEWSE